MKIAREITSCSYICGANKKKWVICTFKISTVLTGRAFNYIFAKQSKKAGKDQGSIQSSTTPDPEYQ